jgi:hypothetical protein
MPICPRERETGLWENRANNDRSDRSSEFKNSMSKHHSITIILGGVVAYFLLIAFCLSQPLPDGLADDPTVKGKGKDGECKIMP